MYKSDGISGEAVTVWEGQGRLPSRGKVYLCTES